MQYMQPILGVLTSSAGQETIVALKDWEQRLVYLMVTYLLRQNPKLENSTHSFASFSNKQMVIGLEDICVS